MIRLKQWTLLALAAATLQAMPAWGQPAAAHVYHNHMPNFWAYYDVTQYAATPVGGPIRYTYDGQVIHLKKNPPSNYTYYLPSGAPMPHDDLVTYYSHHAKTGAYLYWPHAVAQDMRTNAPTGQVHVTMSGAVVNNVQDLSTLKNVSGYDNTSWGSPWKDKYNSLRTPAGNRTLDLIHFTGHHSMGPLVGPEYFLKDLIYQSATLAQPYFLGGDFQSSKGFFPTELGFSERLIPTLAKLGIQWSVIGDNHFSRTLRDYPFLNDPGSDTLVSPPNRADFQNTSTVGSWVSLGMAHEQQVIRNKYPFASTPHWVRYVDPATGAESRVVGIPVNQNGSWLEGWEGEATVDVVNLKNFEGLVPQRQFFVIAHDGDNSGGRAGSESTWYNGRSVTCTAGVQCMGISEYLTAHLPAASDVVHVQDGSWVDTRDSSSDPQWHHWKLPPGIWKGQFPAFNSATGLNLAPKTNLSGIQEGMTVSLEHGWHYLERNFALLQAALNYAKTAEQIWLDAHPNHWKPSTALDNQVTHAGNQLNPWMLSYPVKGDAANDWAGGANPAELSWYFLLPAMDSGFGYYDENQDDNVKPTLSFNQSLYFSKPYVQDRLAQDRTGPSVWWPQRWPYNPGSANTDKSEGWTLHHFSNTFAIYTYAYDVSGLSNIKVRIRTHAGKLIDAADNTHKVYDPAALKAAGVPNIDTSRVSAWVDYPMTRRDLKPVINGVAWQPAYLPVMAKVPAQEIGDLYYTYLGNYRDQLLDYYIEATDSRGNITRSEIQFVYVGAGRYNLVGGKYIEDVNGSVAGTYPFLMVDTTAPSTPTGLAVATRTDRSVKLTWSASTDNVAVTDYVVFRGGTQVGTSTTTGYTDTGLTPSTAYSYTVKARDAAGNTSAASAALSVTTQAPDATAPSVPTGLSASAVTSSSVTLSWTASTDNYGVAGYFVYRNGTQIAAPTGTGYTDSSLSPSTVYSYTVKAADAAGNTSAASAALSITTSTGNTATVYYKKGFATPYIHYRPAGGTWTTPPGIAMPDAEVPGHAKYTVNLATATQLEAVFNNGSGTWDSNNGNNYFFPTGISTFNAGVITPGGPVVDTVSPSAPSNLTSPSKTVSSVTLSWTASTDDVGVTGYLVFRGSTQVGTSTDTTYTDSGLAANTAYSYTVKARDAAGNTSAASTALSVTTASGNTVTVYYKKGFATPYIHYRPAGGTWTTAPGVAMPNAEVTGYAKSTLNLGSATQLECVFNNGSGTWDNNGGLNYFIPAGTHTFNAGTVTAGAPSGDVTGPSTPTGLAVSSKTATSVSLTWNAVTDASGVVGYNVYRGGVLVGAPTSPSYTDTGLSTGTTYSYTVRARDAAGNLSASSAALSVTTSSTGATVTFTVTASTGVGQNVYLVGNLAALGAWSPSAAIALSPANYPAWSVTLSLPGSTALEYKYIKKDANGNVTWESGSNRLYTTPASSAATLNDTWK
ncbi:carbohydrate binding domain-containing protein [Stigmatella aurantiaca]|uniref:Alpha-amylase n=1 Tax=Stigmatella aurantiaca (strain DW4/3-1) TaxID=378806 RepID=Q08T95_STIAD|nr:carbohydrate binding domain-containing protein [Stigmatella aurantiaca]ADO68763.1 Alpha-amylase [Stigmatella aurantiaca DW4/3-1]EAU63707.1 beta/alpha-amylase [Stigmatella aurantiaca DW4/3-1]